jgi:hypothetical protein
VTKTKKYDKQPHKLLFHQLATNSDIYAKSETKAGYTYLTYRTGIINHKKFICEKQTEDENVRNMQN